MEIQITSKTKTREIIPFLTNINIEELVKQVDVVALETPVVDMTIEEFEVILSDPNEYIKKLAFNNKKALIFLGRVKDLLNSLEGFGKFLKRYEVKQTSEEKQAMNNVPFPSFGNAMLVTLIEFYHLNSVEQASKMKVKEWMLCFEYQASNAMFNRRYSEIMTKKSKMKK